MTKDSDSPAIQFMGRVGRVTSMVSNLVPILDGAAAKDPWGWVAIPFVMKLLLLWMGDELRWLLPFVDGTEKHQIQGLIPPPSDALDRIERLQAALRTPWITEEELTPEQVALAKDMLAIIEPPPNP
jgi:hypothetical protein